MPLYRYEAINERGETEQGMMEVGDEIALYETLRARGWVLVKASRKAVPLMRKKKVTPRALAEFCRHMDHVIRAGIPILQGLEDITTATTDEFFKGVLLAIIRDIENGKSFSEALEAHPHVFSRFFIAVVRAGETTGQLDKSFHDLAAYLEWTINLKARIKQAITYPIIVIVLIVIALIIFITYVIPKLVKFISEMNMPLPLPTKILIAFEGLFERFWFVPLILFAALLIFFALSKKMERVRYIWDKYKLRLPVLGKLFYELVISRFLRYAEMLYRAGIQIYDMLGITKEVLNNRYVEAQVEAVRDLVMGGESLSSSMSKVGVFPLLIHRSVRVGESTGTLDSIFQELGRQYDEEIDRTLRRVVSMIEPILLIIIGLVMLAIILSVLWPIYTLIGKIG